MDKSRVEAAMLDVRKMLTVKRFEHRKDFELLLQRTDQLCTQLQDFANFDRKTRLREESVEGTAAIPSKKSEKSGENSSRVYFSEYPSPTSFLSSKLLISSDPESVKPKKSDKVLKFSENSNKLFANRKEKNRNEIMSG